jgi:hypothetical protein
MFPEKFSISLFLIGGFFYTIGAFIYVIKRPDPWPDVFSFHDNFHIFVIFKYIHAEPFAEFYQAFLMAGGAEMVFDYCLNRRKYSPKEGEYFLNRAKYSTSAS